ncbi:MAG: uroporphyrinogen decarboxylase family protein [Methylacidiphilales bacterium]|nr:uroporphyrinogen decarboxylase family protein [Candidatus Methylacidiphilales bacterium]
MTTDAQKISSAHARLGIRRKGEIVPREEYLDYMTFRTNARPMFTEIFGPIIGLKEEWATQGATAEELDFSAFHYRWAESFWLPTQCGWLGGDPDEILEETEDLLVYRDAMGRKMEMSKKNSTLALPATHPVKTMQDWLRIKHHYEFCEERLSGNWRPPSPGMTTVAAIPGGFDEPRQLMGEEALAIACYEEPELIHDILQTIGQTAFRVLERMTKEVKVDLLHVHEDMAGCSGPLFGPRQVMEFIVPYYRSIWDLLSSRGTRLFMQDSDGDMRPVIPSFLEAGVNFMYPCEPMAGMDIVQLRAQYGNRLAFMGGIDKHILRQSKEKITAELEYKIPPMVRSGGCILGLDHRVPNGTPLSSYRFYIQKAWEIMDRVGRE